MTDDFDAEERPAKPLVATQKPKPTQAVASPAGPLFQYGVRSFCRCGSRLARVMPKTEEERDVTNLWSCERVLMGSGTDVCNRDIKPRRKNGAYTVLWELPPVKAETDEDE